MKRKIRENNIQIKNKGNTNFTHLAKGTFARLNTAIRIPEVGIIRFENPSPHVNANTAVWRVMPTKSAKGAINGIVTAACPEPEGIKKFKVV